MKTLKEKLRSLTLQLLVAAAVMVAALDSHGQGYQPDRATPITITPPFSSIAGGSASNFSASVITSFTNVTTAWSSASAAFVNTTNITSVTNTVNAETFVGGQQSWPLQIVTKSDAANTANMQMLVERSADKVKWGLPTAHVNAQTGTTESVWQTNLATYGFPYIRTTWFSNAAAIGGASITNVAMKWVQSQNARP